MSFTPGVTPAPSTSSNIFSGYLGGANPSTSTAGGLPFATGGSMPGATPAVSSAPGSQINSPSAAVSPYYFQQIIIGAKNITLGPTLAYYLGLDPARTYTGGEVMQAYFDMPQNMVVQLQQLLDNAGYYAKASNGVPLQRQEAGDVHSAAGMDAMALAIQDAINQQAPLSDVVVHAAVSGIGLEQNAQALPVVSGGGNVYQVNTISGDTAYTALKSAFEQALGRAPTQSELDNFITSYNSQITTYQQAQNLQKEQMSQNIYQTQIASRAATHGMANIPPETGIPAASDPYSAAASILTVMGMQPTAGNIQVVAALINATGGFTAKSTTLLGISPTNGTGTAALIEAAANLLSSGKYEQLNMALATDKASSMGSDPTIQSEFGNLTGGKTVKIPTKPSPQATKAAQAITAAQNQAAAATPQPPQSANAAERGNQIPGTTPSREMAPSYMGPLATNLTDQNAVNATLQAGATNPQVGAFLQAGQAAQANTALGQTSQSPYLTSPGDYYVPSSTLNETTPATPQEAATTMAETGANRIPYLGNQFLQAYQDIITAMEAKIQV